MSPMSSDIENEITEKKQKLRFLQLLSREVKKRREAKQRKFDDEEMAGLEVELSEL